MSGEGLEHVSSAALSLNLASFANVENLILTGTASLDLTGNAGSNVLTGNSGNNIIVGGAGIDVMAGGAGNDTYDIDILADSVLEVDGAGTDTVRSSTMNLNLFFYANAEI